MISKAAFDAEFHAAALGVGGLSDARDAVYTPPATVDDPTPVGVPARVFVGRRTGTLGDYRQKSVAALTVTYLRADVTPVPGGRVAFDSETWVNVEELEESADGLVSDDSVSVWAVRRG